MCACVHAPACVCVCVCVLRQIIYFIYVEILRMRSSSFDADVTRLPHSQSAFSILRPRSTKVDKQNVIKQN